MLPATTVPVQSDGYLASGAGDGLQLITALSSGSCRMDTVSEILQVPGESDADEGVEGYPGSLGAPPGSLGQRAGEANA